MLVPQSCLTLCDPMDCSHSPFKPDAALGALGSHLFLKKEKTSNFNFIFLLSCPRSSRLRGKPKCKILTCTPPLVHQLGQSWNQNIGSLLSGLARVTPPPGPLPNPEHPPPGRHVSRCQPQLPAGGHHPELGIPPSVSPAWMDGKEEQATGPRVAPVG